MYRKALLSLTTVTAIIVFLLATPVLAEARPLAWQTIGHHTVRPGETIYCIGRAYGVSPAAIAAHNGIANPNRIHPGHVLAIPAAYAHVPPGPTCTPQFTPDPPPSICTCATYHTIAQGENLYRISLHYGVNMWHTADCNGIQNVNYIRAGEALCIPAQ